MKAIFQSINPAKLGSIAGLMVLVSLLSGCLYGGQIQQENSPASGEYVLLVQNAVDQFKERTGVLPIKNKPMDTPLYEKYFIDFKKLQDSGLLSLIPTNSFENGGSAIYVLVDVETEPTVKLLDLISYQAMAKLQQEVSDYRNRTGQLPIGETIADGLYWLDRDKLGKNAAVIKSPNSAQTLPVFVDESGSLFIDYSLDIRTLLDKREELPDEDLDLREIIVEESLFVPVWSKPYQLNDGEPAVVAM